jgi:hypothetical protein
MRILATESLVQFFTNKLDSAGNAVFITDGTKQSSDNEETIGGT